MQSVPGSVRCVTLEALKTSEGSTGNIPNIRRNIRTPWHHHDITVTSPWHHRDSHLCESKEPPIASTTFSASGLERYKASVTIQNRYVKCANSKIKVWRNMEKIRTSKYRILKGKDGKDFIQRIFEATLGPVASAKLVDRWGWSQPPEPGTARPKCQALDQRAVKGC